jgi:hypothetical protein
MLTLVTGQLSHCVLETVLYLLNGSKSTELKKFQVQGAMIFYGEQDSHCEK